MYNKLPLLLLANLLVKFFLVCDAINQLEKSPVLTGFKVGLLSPIVAK